MGAAFGNAENFGDFGQFQSGIEAQFHQLGGFFILLFQCFQCFVYGNELIRFHLHGDVGTVEINPLPIAAAFEGVALAGALDEDAPHRFCGCPEEVPAVVPCLQRGIDQPDIGLVHQRRGLQSLVLPGGFLAHAGARQHAEFLVDERQEFFRGAWIGLRFERVQNAGDIVFRVHLR